MRHSALMLRTRGIALVLLLLLPACTTGYWAERADVEVAEVIREKESDFIRFRERELIHPDLKTGGEAGERASAADADLSDVPREVGLEEALAVATTRNRGYRSQKESLYLSALDLTNVRNQFSIFFTGTLGAILADTNQGAHSNRNDASIGASRILPTGGTASAEVRTTTAAAGDAKDYTFDSEWSVGLTQPLLRDAGYESSHEALTRAEREVIYAIRDFELFREDFTIRVLAQFYSLVGLLQAIENAERDLEAREFLKRQSQEKFDVGLATEVDKLRSEREYLRAENDLIIQRQTYRLALDRFKVLLGLPTDFPLTIRREEPRFTEVKTDLVSLVPAALNNRLDLITSRDRLEDAERNLRIRTQNLLPDLDLSAEYARSTPVTTTPHDQPFENEAYTIGLTLDIPLERTAERNALRRAMIDLDRAKRDLSLQEDDVILEVRDSLRSLRRAEASVEIRLKEIEVAEKEAEAAQIRFEAGEMDNRNVTDARNAVLESQNAYIRDLVAYETARIQLLRDVGILFIDDNGMWVEP